MQCDYHRNEDINQKIVYKTVNCIHCQKQSLNNTKKSEKQRISKTKCHFKNI